MRGTYDSDIVIKDDRKTLKNNNNQPILVGFTFGADACTEHEIGNEKLRDAFGCDPEAEPGLSRRTIQTITTKNYKLEEIPLLGYFEDENYAVLIGNSPGVIERIETSLKKGKTLAQLVDSREIADGLQPPFFRDDGELDEWEVSASWDDRSFGLLCPKKTAPFLRELKEQFEKKNIVIMMAGRQTPFGGCGLSLAIADRLPQEVIDKWRKSDISNDKLKAYEDKLKLHEMLRDTWTAPYNVDQWGHPKYGTVPGGYLRAEWPLEGMAKDPEFQTEHDVVFFLNPSNQEDNYWGYVTVEDLLLWKLGRGKIPGGGRNPSPKIKALSENEDACYKWMIERLVKDGCPLEEAEKYSFNQYIYDFYEDDWEQFVEDAVQSASYQRV